MDLEINYLISAVVMGIGGVVMMDLWNLLLKSAFGIPSLNYCLLGRWVLHMPSTFQHRSIAAAQAKPGECAVGWTAHYSIGISMAVMFVLLVRGDWLQQPTPGPALIFGVATVVFPFLVMQPALGLGMASAKAPSPSRARLKSLGTHCVFGEGLYLTAAGARLLHLIG